MNVLVTGVSGFVGRAFCAHAIAHHSLRGVTRSLADLPKGVAGALVTEINESTKWDSALLGCDVVVHLAARVHVIQETSADPLSAFRRVNVEGTLNLAQQAAYAGVRRFVFVSSIKVNGESTATGSAFFASDAPAPLNAYGVSKMEAEQGLREIARNTGMEVAIIRPPLVYGPRVKGNFQVMMRWLSRGVPLPLGAINNKRSLVVLDNLIDLITICIDHPAAAAETFLVSDGEDLSTTQLLRRMGQALGKPARLIPVPPALLKAGSELVRKPELAERLCGSLQVDISKTRQLLRWNPRISVDEGLRTAAAGFQK